MWNNWTWLSCDWFKKKDIGCKLDLDLCIFCELEEEEPWYVNVWLETKKIWLRYKDLH